MPTYLLAKLGRMGQRVTQAAISDQGLLPPHFSVLATLGDFGSLAQHELADRLALKPSHLVGYVDELERREVIVRERDPADRRRQLISLTAQGRALLTQLRTQIEDAEQSFLTGLSQGQRTALMKLLLRLLEHADHAALSDHDELDPNAD